MSSERKRSSEEVFCRHCGEAIKVQAEVCPHCGVRNEQYGRSMGGTGDSTGGFGGSTGSIGDSTSGTSLEPNVAAALSYALGFVSGIAVYVLEDDDRFVRFHAAQSIVVFGGLAVANAVTSAVFAAIGIGSVAALLSGLISLLTVGLWVFLIATAYQGKTQRITVAADVADELFSVSSGTSRTSSGGSGGANLGTATDTDALAALRQRYARGEIDEAEFERRLERLLESEGAEGNHWHEPAETEQSR